ncbi:MAG: DNA repair protein RecO [Candidatus Omnitrophota bacterium]
MPIQKTEAIVIHKREFRETSIIANFYSRDFGKLSGLLKGIRAQPGKFASSLEPFSYNEIIFYPKTKSALHLVSQCDLIDNFDSIRANVIKTGICSIMMELLDAIMPPEDKNEEVFNLSMDCIRELSVTNNPHKVLTIFKIKILALSGFKPHFDSCVICADRVIGQCKFSLTLGGLLCEKCYNKDLSSRVIFRGTVASILHIEKNDFRKILNLGMNPQIKKELDLILESFLNFHLGKELKSQRVLNKIEVTV